LSIAFSRLDSNLVRDVGDEIELSIWEMPRKELQMGLNNSSIPRIEDYPNFIPKSFRSLVNFTIIVNIKTELDSIVDCHEEEQVAERAHLCKCNAFLGMSLEGQVYKGLVNRVDIKI
jgi:hypothetical protein